MKESDGEADGDSGGTKIDGENIDGTGDCDGGAEEGGSGVKAKRRDGGIAGAEIGGGGVGIFFLRISPAALGAFGTVNTCSSLR